MKRLVWLDKTFVFALVASVVGFFCSYDWMLFWDTVQFGSKHSLYFLDHGLGNMLLPDGLDSGHPTFFGLYLSGCLYLFGRELWVLHAAMIPFSMLFWYYVLSLSRVIFYKESYYFIALVVLCPMVMGHIMLVSPDVVLWMALMMLIYAHITTHSRLKTVSIILLCAISMRGGAVAFSFFLAEYILSLRRPFISKFNALLAVQKIQNYFLGVLLLLTFLIYHYYQKGWIGYHEDSPWAASFEVVNFTGFIKNIVVYIWRLLDQGMLFIYLPLVYFLYKYRWSDRVKMLSIFWIILFVVMAVLVLPYKGLLNHRYFVPLHLVALMLIVEQVLYRVSIAFRRMILVPVALLMVSGCFWVYPAHIAQAWDVTPAHWGIYKVERELHKYSRDNNIKTTDIATAFPLLNTQDHLKLSRDTSMYQRIDLTSSQYVLYSNIMNDISDEQRAILLGSWVPIWEEQKWGVEMILFKNPKS